MFSVSLYYGYRHLRQLVKKNYPTNHVLDHPESISDTVSWKKLQEIRRESDYEALNGYAYARIGNDAIVDQWIEYGIERGLLGGFWRCEIEQLVSMERGPANEILMSQLRFDQL